MIKRFCANLAPGFLPILKRLELGRNENDAAEAIEAALLSLFLSIYVFLTFEIFVIGGRNPLLFQLVLMAIFVSGARLLRMEFYRSFFANVFRLGVSLFVFSMAILIGDLLLFVFRGLKGFHLVLFVLAVLFIVNMLLSHISVRGAHNLKTLKSSLIEIRHEAVALVLLFFPIVIGLFFIEVAYHYERMRLSAIIGLAAYILIFLWQIRRRTPGSLALSVAKQAIKSAGIGVAVAASGLIILKLAAG